MALRQLTQAAVQESVVHGLADTPLSLFCVAVCCTIGTLVMSASVHGISCEVWCVGPASEIQCCGMCNVSGTVRFVLSQLVSMLLQIVSWLMSNIVDCTAGG